MASAGRANWSTTFPLRTNLCEATPQLCRSLYQVVLCVYAPAIRRTPRDMSDDRSDRPHMVIVLVVLVMLLGTLSLRLLEALNRCSANF